MSNYLAKLHSREETAYYLRSKGERDSTTLARASRAALFCIEMVLTRFARNDFPIAGYAKSLGI